MAEQNSNDPVGDYVMVRPKEISDRLGMSRAGVSKAIQRLVAEHDIPVEKDSRDRVVRVSLAHFEHYRNKSVNPAKAKPEQPSGPDGGMIKSFNEARAQNEWLKNSHERLKLQKAMGETLRADKIDEAVARCRYDIQARIDRLANNADDLALAVTREGVHGLRLKLRELAFAINTDIADVLERVAVEAPEFDPLIEAIGE